MAEPCAGQLEAPVAPVGEQAHAVGLLAVVSRGELRLHIGEDLQIVVPAVDLGIAHVPVEIPPDHGSHGGPDRRRALTVADGDVVQLAVSDEVLGELQRVGNAGVRKQILAVGFDQLRRVVSKTGVVQQDLFRIGRHPEQVGQIVRRDERAELGLVLLRIRAGGDDLDGDAGRFLDLLRNDVRQLAGRHIIVDAAKRDRDSHRLGIFRRSGGRFFGCLGLLAVRGGRLGGRVVRRGVSGRGCARAQDAEQHADGQQQG